jgi:hypothetical protein
MGPEKENIMKTITKRKLATLSYASIIACYGLLMNACTDQSDSDQSTEAGGEAHTISLDGVWNVKTANTSSGDPAEPHPQYNFSYSCQNVSVIYISNGSYAQLSADCQNTNGQWIHSNMDLNACIGNSESNLQFRHGGNFQASCQGDWINSRSFGASCRNSSGYYNPASIDLNQGISNNNGYLRCD